MAWPKNSVNRVQSKLITLIFAAETNRLGVARLDVLVALLRLRLDPRQRAARSGDSLDRQEGVASKRTGNKGPKTGPPRKLLQCIILIEKWCQPAFLSKSEVFNRKSARNGLSTLSLPSTPRRLKRKSRGTTNAVLWCGLIGKSSSYRLHFGGTARLLADS
jgi:hypothetical protein